MKYRKVKLKKPLTHMVWHGKSGGWKPTRDDNFPDLNFPDGVPLKEILEHLSLPYHGFVSKETANNWETIYSDLQKILVPWNNYYEEDYVWNNDVSIVDINRKNIKPIYQNVINWISTIRAFDYFYQWFHSTFFSDSKVCAGVFFEWFCLKNGQVYTYDEFKNVLYHSSLDNKTKNKLVVIFKNFTPPKI